MRVRLDENFGRRGAEILVAAGHDVATVPDEGLCSATDRKLAETCRNEKRCLVTLDLDFGNPLRFRPPDYSGIAVVRLRGRAEPSDIESALRLLAATLDARPIDGKLWIVEPARLREYQPGN